MEQTPGSSNSCDATLPLAGDSSSAEQGFDTSPTTGCNDALPHQILNCNMAESAEHASHSKTFDETMLFEATTNSPRQSQAVDADVMSVNDAAADTDSAPANGRFAGNSLLTDLLDLTGTGQDGSEGVRSSSRNRALSVAAIQPTQSDMMKRKRSTAQKSLRKDDTRPMSHDKREALLEELISHERRKSESLGLQDTFTCLLTQECILSLGKDQHRPMLRVFFFAIASSESLAFLQEVLRGCRNKPVGDLSEPVQSLSNAERFKVIERLDENIAYFSFLKRCHVLKLFTDNYDRQSDDGFIVETQESVSTRTRGDYGNPNHVAEAAITRSMIQEVYPRLRCDTDEYKRKYRSVSELRKQGRRLHLLTTTFGYGILGLLPSAACYSAVGLNLCISDNMLRILLYLPSTIMLTKT